MKTSESYNGFEQDPIRPPIDAGSLGIRITCNGPWKRLRGGWNPNVEDPYHAG